MNIAIQFYSSVLNVPRPPGAEGLLHLIYHRKFHKKSIYLYVHIFTGLTEALRYRISETLQGHSDILPDYISVLSCFIWSWTSFELVKTLRRGDPLTTRPPYQAAALLRLFITLLSYLFCLPSLHRVSITSLDSFIYARFAIFFFTYAPYIRNLFYGAIYRISIPLAATLSVHESRVPGASLVFVLAAAYVARLNEWVTQKSRSLRNPESSVNISIRTKALVSIILRIGFAELEELMATSKASGLEKPVQVQDEYVPEKYSSFID
ncbi:uncharacterized protein N7483_002584 [Penicillium malachiteum]|uniref:uncharacterized protein n=1 Tax=Penicillium malachiteum TaxID=1324776 RepID=UPI0025482FAC|nr:uncharacterized protein N7483_002584 [Penicillium malachiteum]KAJ5737459.1 hypothetical protein N7483_002584 [Penicillium malachiteum]